MQMCTPLILKLNSRVKGWIWEIFCDHRLFFYAQLALNSVEPRSKLPLSTAWFAFMGKSGSNMISIICVSCRWNEWVQHESGMGVWELHVCFSSFAILCGMCERECLYMCTSESKEGVRDVKYQQALLWSKFMLLSGCCG